MEDTRTRSGINMTELLIQISKDVASIKTDITNFKESQKAEKEVMAREIEDVRCDFKRDLADLEAKVFGKLGTLQTVQNNLVGDVDVLKHADEKKDAKKWRGVITCIATALGGMLLAKLPDICLAVLNQGAK